METDEKRGIETIRPALIVALDGMDEGGALALVDRLGEGVRFYKVGLELFTRAGPAVVRRLREKGKEVFLDLKLHDIPATVEKAARAGALLDVAFLDVHASGGRKMIAAAAGALEGSGTKLLAVTVLTSLGGAGVADEVARLALEARKGGADGVVASVSDVGRIRRACGESFLIVTPGIRPATVRRDDQSRVATPAEAARAGSDHIVVGRPVTLSDEPVAVVEKIRKEIAGAQR